jgi:hypothetical protein
MHYVILTFVTEIENVQDLQGSWMNSHQETLTVNGNVCYFSTGNFYSIEHNNFGLELHGYQLVYVKNNEAVWMNGHQMGFLIWKRVIS